MILVEVFKDISMRALPVDSALAKEMIEEIKGISILKGLRGEKSVNIDAVADLIVKVAQLAEANEDIQEIDLNPVIVNNEAASVVDARLMR